MTIFLEAFKAGKHAPARTCSTFVDDYDSEGLTKQIKFDENGDVDPSRTSSSGPTRSRAASSSPDAGDPEG